MAEDEAVEEIKEGDAAEEKGGKKGGGGLMANPIIPVILIVLLVPMMTWVMLQFVFLPTVTSKLEAFQASPVSEEELEAEEPAEQGIVQTYEFENVVANISGALQSRYIKVSFTVEGTAMDFVEQIESNKAKLKDSALTVLSSVNVTDLEKPGIKNIIKNDLLSGFEITMKKELIQQLYFSEFVIQ